MTYPEINGTLAGQDLTYLFIYANSVTHGYFGLFMVIAFFLVVLMGSIIIQFRFTNRIRFETSLLASSFATLGFAVILEQVTGILQPVYFWVIVGMTIISFLWVAISSGE